MVLLIAKNFQLVKFSQVDFLIKNPASLRADLRGVNFGKVRTPR